MASFNLVINVPLDKIIDFIFGMAVYVGEYLITFLRPDIEQIRSQNITFGHLPPPLPGCALAWPGMNLFIPAYYTGKIGIFARLLLFSAMAF
jgi:hypothetical protein